MTAVARVRSRGRQSPVFAGSAIASLRIRVLDGVCSVQCRFGPEIKVSSSEAEFNPMSRVDSSLRQVLFAYAISCYFLGSHGAFFALASKNTAF